MVLPRPALIAILGGVLVLAAFMVTRATGQAGDEPTAPAPTSEAPAAPAQSAQKPEPRAASNGLPAAIERALARKQTFVLLFTQKGGADDSATRAAVDALSGVAVLRADIGDIGEYRRVVEDLGIERAPAVVIVDRRGQARLVEGYTDAGSLAQQVEDAR